MPGTTDTICSMDPDSSCGKCANVACVNDHECQTGECVDYVYKCYDPVFWIVILFVTLGVILIIVAVTTFLLVRKRRLVRVANTLVNASESTNQT